MKIKGIKDFSLLTVIVILFTIMVLLGVYIMCASCDREPLMTVEEINELDWSAEAAEQEAARIYELFRK